MAIRLLCSASVVVDAAGAEERVREGLRVTRLGCAGDDKTETTTEGGCSVFFDEEKGRRESTMEKHTETTTLDTRSAGEKEGV